MPYRFSTVGVTSASTACCFAIEAVRSRAAGNATSQMDSGGNRQDRVDDRERIAFASVELVHMSGRRHVAEAVGNLEASLVPRSRGQAPAGSPPHELVAMRAAIAAMRTARETRQGRIKSLAQ